VNPEILKYHESHSWLNVEHADVCTVGVTRHAQEQLGDIVFVQLPVVGATVKQGEACMAIESTKTVADVHAPASGVVTEVNAALGDTPERVNSAPYSTWLFRMTLGDPAELESLLSVTDYQKIAEI
jgi:glycine cleavage system H protein